MYGPDYHFRAESPVLSWGRSIAAWFKASQLGWKWLAVVLPFAGISAWTNIAGLKLALDGPAAYILGIAIQIALLYACIQLIHSGESGRRRWAVPVYAIMVCSIFFSFAGFTSFYGDMVDARVRPMRARDDLKVQATNLASSIAEAKELAGSKLTNRIEDAQNIIGRVERKASIGGYDNPAEPEAMIGEQETKIQSAAAAKAQWDAFTFDPQSAVGATDLNEGFQQMQSAHSKLSTLMGTLRAHEKEAFTMPSPPVLSLLESEAAPKQNIVEHTITQLFTLAGWFWLFMAFLLEAVPFWLAKANKPAGIEEEYYEEDEDGEPIAQPIAQPLADPHFAHPLSVQPVGPADADLARRYSDIHSIARTVCQVWSMDNKDLEQQTARVDTVNEGLRKLAVEKLQTIILSENARERMQRLDLLVQSLRRMGAPEQEIRILVKSTCDELIKDFNVSDLNLERLREERREAALQPSAEMR